MYWLVSGCCTCTGQALVLNFDGFITLYMIKLSEENSSFSSQPFQLEYTITTTFFLVPLDTFGSSTGSAHIPTELLLTFAGSSGRNALSIRSSRKLSAGSGAAIRADSAWKANSSTGSSRGRSIHWHERAGRSWRRTGRPRRRGWCRDRGTSTSIPNEQRQISAALRINQSRQTTLLNLSTGKWSW